MLCLDVILFIGYVILWVTLVDVDVTSVRVCGGGKCPMSVICFFIEVSSQYISEVLVLVLFYSIVLG